LGAQKSFSSLVTAGVFWRTTLQHFWHLFHGVLFFPLTAPCTMMANDAQEETSCDAKRRVQQFIKEQLKCKMMTGSKG
jgi:hypothetical protein